MKDTWSLIESINMEKLFICLGIFVWIGSAQAKDLSAYTIDQVKTESAPWKINAIIFKNELHPKDEPAISVYRQFLGVTQDGYYVVQDFFSEGKRKRTDPYQTTEKNVGIPALNPVNDCLLLWEEGGNKRLEGCFDEHGQETGLFSAWYASGAKLLDGHFFKGIAQGQWFMWHRDGSKQADIMIVQAGEENSPVTLDYRNAETSLRFNSSFNQSTASLLWAASMWHEDGKKAMEVNALSHKKDKTIFAWNENGILISQATQKPDGSLYLLQFFIDEQEKNQSKKVKAMEMRVNKHKNGSMTMWNKKGQKISEQIYSEQGQKVRMRTWNDEGKLIQTMQN